MRILLYYRAVIKLGCRGRLYGFDVNTINFNDAAPLTVTIEASPPSQSRGPNKVS